MTTVPQLLLTALDALSLVFLALYLMQMVAAALLPIRPRRTPPDATLHFTFLVPALNEETVIAATVRNVHEVAPEARVVVIDDGSDDATAATAEALARADAAVRVLRRQAPDARQGKGQALNWAARRLLRELHAAGADLTREVFAVIDADARITPALLHEARQAMADAFVMGAQSRVRIRPSVTRLTAQTLVGAGLEQQQDLEFFITRHVQCLRQSWHSVGLFGNGQFMRASYLEGQFTRGHPAWPDCLSEDFASSLEMRLADRHHRMAFLEAAVTQQGLPDLRRFLRQRARWTQGTLQCLGYLPRLWSSHVPWAARLDLTYFLLNPWMNGLIVVSFLTQPLRWALGAHGVVLSPAVSAAIAVMNLGLQLQWVLRYQRAHHLNARQVLFLLPGLLIYGSALLLSLPMAYWHHWTGRRTWDKSIRHAEAPDRPTSADGYL